ncbi:hypothetical protein NC653_025842 [Populus alba x Populus x berolinensis]|uniref:Uncharacterized protein n=1 Tax=Populus alba x Populus x berolinensis TaxID=444605 RepID=A0AAD6MCB4_9ROSI|nr:hypothetical protein NC653_025842 [Populus alba x Populus x berolinensis]
MHTNPTPMNTEISKYLQIEIALMQCFCKLLEWRVNASYITCQTVCKALMYKFLHEYTFPNIKYTNYYTVTHLYQSRQPT